MLNNLDFTCVQTQRLFSALDLTALDETLTLPRVQQLCLESRSALGDVAALCLPARFVPYARQYLEQANINEMPIATVCNFPHGGDDLRIAYAETKAAVAYGADEVDLVLPYQALLSGDYGVVHGLIQGCRAICGDLVVMKVILETGVLKSPELIRVACEIAISSGADFLKTSTGTTEIGATLDAAQTVLEVIKEADGLVGFKASGGIASIEDAQSYLNLADEILGADWVRPANFRIGSSQLHHQLMQTIPETAYGQTAH